MHPTATDQRRACGRTGSALTRGVGPHGRQAKRSAGRNRHFNALGCLVPTHQRLYAWRSELQSLHGVTLILEIADAAEVAAGCATKHCRRKTLRRSRLNQRDNFRHEVGAVVRPLADALPNFRFRRNGVKPTSASISPSRSKAWKPLGMAQLPFFGVARIYRCPPHGRACAFAAAHPVRSSILRRPISTVRPSLAGLSEVCPSITAAASTPRTLRQAEPAFVELSRSPAPSFVAGR